MVKESFLKVKALLTIPRALTIKLIIYRYIQPTQLNEINLREQVPLIRVFTISNNSSIGTPCLHFHPDA